MSKITLDKDKYFIETKKVHDFPFGQGKVSEKPILIPVRNITDVNSEEDYNGIDYAINIYYYNRGYARNAVVCYKTKRERDKDWKKLSNLERTR